MIYLNSYFRKEVRQAYLDQQIGLRRQLFFALFIGLLSFSVFFVLQTLKKSVLSDAVPELMQASFFSTIYLYIHAAAAAVTVYFFRYYDFLFFSEIRRNAWYLLIQMRYRPIGMIVQKMTALLCSMAMIYTVGFAFTALLTVFLKYTFTFDYVPTLYIAGLADVALLAVLAALLSLFVNKTEDARLLIIGAAVFLFVCKALAGAYGILRNRVLMQELHNLFDTSRSWFYPISAAVFLAGMIIVFVRAQRLAKYYWPSDREDEALPAGVTVVRMDAKQENQRDVKKATHFEKQRKMLSVAVTALLTVFILAVLGLNVLIILISTATPGNEITIRGTIPYVFQSDTMQPSIMSNDLVFFRKIDVQYPLEEAQIVLFKENNIIYVERIVQITQDALQVDVDHYPPGAETGAMFKQISRAAVYGVYSGRSRWLGVLILFANTIMGRILFLFVPSIFLFYRKQIAAFFKKYREK